jgi:hypothetical protein
MKRILFFDPTNNEEKQRRKTEKAELHLPPFASLYSIWSLPVMPFLTGARDCPLLLDPCLAKCSPTSGGGRSHEREVAADLVPLRWWRARPCQERQQGS